MFGRLIKILIGFALACLAAGLTKVLFATTPSELANLPPDLAADKMSKVFESGVFAGIVSAMFAAPFALVAAAIGEWRRLRDWVYYAAAGVAIALIGLLAQYSGEAQGAPTIVNNYALGAYLTAGFVGGLVYWLFAGRTAGGMHAPAMTTTSTGSSTGGGKPAMSTDKPKPVANNDKPKPSTASVPSTQPKKV